MLIEDLQIVLKVAEFRSITAAATSLDMRTATASAAVKRVEQALGAELFVRTTRQLRLSSAGEKYLPQCEQALQMLEQARQNIRGDLDLVEGQLRLAVSSDLGRNRVMPWLDSFTDQYPALTLRIHISDSTVDFYRDAVDMALRYGSPNDASLYGFKICDVPGVLCASPGYLESRGVPSHPHDLASHNGLFYQLHDIPHDVWTFTRGEAQFKVKMQGNRTANDGDLVRRWCVAGKGVAVKSCLDMADDLLAGRVVNVLPEYRPRSTELWLICPSRQSITPAMRLLRDDLQARCRDILHQLRTRHLLPAES
ncbi:LysR substrate-binding domain-containing protein [Microbulbifer thermotolerans]|uniref:LysR substrate-binding domain-containing protein n=1 Tax=Microbulbifer thermotolerans TaxID=252514 RepID=A0AB35HXS9_MICTH|nr:LysR family transcriptional regulator [Microbulbifer thermotolerans]MCX2801716.1 LysR substrate-binding domain-containing protein [Microbulbifer thermotolerans]MCX2840910.1 LysR substrate-binding domain-containing protein [Microbulbifer thermotolerans]WKT60601.1 LysR substrate-binding domain-containing protein [Microbulbifer thermotolerans]